MKTEIEYRPGLIEWLRKRRAAFGTLAASIALAGCTLNVQTSNSTSSATPGRSASPTIQDGCAPFEIYAQNVWPATPNGDDYGASVRSNPDIHAKRIDGVPGNHPILVNGWEKASAPIATQNPTDRNGLYWFRRVDGGWVNNAAVRAEQTEQDPSKGYDKNYVDTSPAVPLKPECEIK